MKMVYETAASLVSAHYTALLLPCWRQTITGVSIFIGRGLLNGAIFIDLKKAFNTIDHEIILKILTKYGVDQDALKKFKP